VRVPGESLGKSRGESCEGCRPSFAHDHPICSAARLTGVVVIVVSAIVAVAAVVTPFRRSRPLAVPAAAGAAPGHQNTVGEFLGVGVGRWAALFVDLVDKVITSYQCVVGPLAVLAGPADDKRYALVVPRVKVYLIRKHAGWDLVGRLSPFFLRRQSMCSNG